MSELTEYVEEPSEESGAPESNFATVAGIEPDGLRLVFDGQDEETEKHYKCNCFAVFKNGDRVKVFKDSGTYVVEYPLGNPKREFACTVAERLKTARKITLAGGAEGAGSFDGSEDIEIRVTKLTGTIAEAEKAQALKTARTIALSGGATGNATLFDGTKNITILVSSLDASRLSGSVGEAEKAVVLKTSRTIALSGAVTGTATAFDGSKNITIPVTSIDGSKLTGTIRASAVQNMYNFSSNYNIQFQSDYSGKIFARVGTGTWKQISN